MNPTSLGQSISPVLGKRELTHHQRQRIAANKAEAEAKLSAKRAKGNTPAKSKPTRGTLYLHQNRLWGCQRLDSKTKDLRFACCPAVDAPEPNSVLFAVTNVGAFKTIELTLLAMPPPVGSVPRPLDLWSELPNDLPLANDLRYFGKEARDAFASHMNQRTSATAMFEVAGVSFRKGALRQCLEAGVARGAKGMVEADVGNEHDEHAKKIVVMGKHVGFVPRALAETIVEGECEVLVIKEWAARGSASPKYTMKVRAGKSC